MLSTTRTIALGLVMAAVAITPAAAIAKDGGDDSGRSGSDDRVAQRDDRGGDDRGRGHDDSGYDDRGRGHDDRASHDRGRDRDDRASHDRGRDRNDRGSHDRGRDRNDDRARDDRGRDRQRNRREVRVAGKCTAGARSKLKAKHRDGRLEVEFEVDQNRNGVAWKVEVRRDGALVIDTTAVTRPPSGSFSVERKVADTAGANTITGKATSASGEVCTASLSI
jgi:hypothetical protein